jgi:hypothetical protein
MIIVADVTMDSVEFIVYGPTNAIFDGMVDRRGSLARV